MKLTHIIIFAGTVAAALAGCGNSQSEVLRIVEERDSLRTVASAQEAQLGTYGRMVELINSTLDSISHQESIMFIGSGESPVTREDVQLNLQRFENVLRRQNDKINDLENRLRVQTDSNARTLSLMAHMKQEIATKNRRIAQLKEELENKNVDIARLQEQVNSQQLTINTQQEEITKLNQRTRKQGEALARQDAILNNGYVLIGSKDDLRRKGVINRKGNLVADAALDRTKFAQVDLRKWNEVSFTAKRPRILTNMPASSYELTTTGNGSFTLTVRNPADFWRISNYLVIQTN